jgi:hypothetical protein
MIEDERNERTNVHSEISDRSKRRTGETKMRMVVSI